MSAEKCIVRIWTVFPFLQNIRVTTARRIRRMTCEAHMGKEKCIKDFDAEN
jgi:hypothetical protein